MTIQVILDEKERESIISIIWEESLWFFSAFALKLQETLKKEDTYKLTDDKKSIVIPYSDGIGDYSFKLSKLKKYPSG